MPGPGDPLVLDIYPWPADISLPLTKRKCKSFIGHKCKVFYRQAGLPGMVEGIVVKININDKKGFTTVAWGSGVNDVDYVWAYKIELVTTVLIEELLTHPQKLVRDFGQEKIEESA